MLLHLLVKWEVVSPNSRWGQWESISNIILYSLVLIFDLKHIKFFGGEGGGGGVIFFLHFRKTIVDRDSGNLYLIYIYKKIVVLASEPVGGRYRVTELPCFLKCAKDDI